MKPMIKFFDAISGEELVREMNDEEYEIHLRDLDRVQKAKEEYEDAQKKREIALAKLSALGLDMEDLKALGL
jgi:uncharacterized membrane protein